jgi:nicotinamide-nucleotide adenylyltransferase
MGHLLFLQSICKLYDEIIIGIGSSQYQDTKDNPFSYDEREMMIVKSLDAIDIHNYRIITIPDIHNPPKWVAHVVSIVSDFDVVLSNNSLTKKLFSEKGYKVEKTSFIKRDIYSGKEIRKRMRQNKPWEELVPKSVAQIIMDINGLQRVQEIVS